MKKLHAIRETVTTAGDEEANALLAAVVESSDDAIISKTLDGIVTSWNAGAERLFGYTRDEVIGQAGTMIIPTERRYEERMILRRLGGGERVEHFDTVRVAKSGQRIEVSIGASPIRDRRGKIIGASKVIRDVTDSRRAERALRESEERFRTLADNIAQLAWMADGTGQILWYNQRWFEFTGTTLEQVKGWGWQAVHHPDHVDRVVEKISRCFLTGEVWEDTFPLRGADGTYRWFLSRAVPIRDDQGRVSRWFGTNTDVTLQREAEEALKQSDRRKDEFLATLAHELRNPLAPLRNSLAIVERANGNRDMLQHAHDVMTRQLGQLQRLIDDLLDVARISHDHIELRREQLNLASVIELAVENCNPFTEIAGIELTVSLPLDRIEIHGDPIRLSEVFGNLLHNAFKYSDIGKRVWLEARREGAEAVVTVRDAGRGIPPEQLPHVFEMFAQLDQPAERVRSGLGIGLTLARHLVELHGGTVDGSSKGVGRGSEFTVRLPLSVANGVPAAAPSSVEVRSPRRRVLIVDDNVDAAESLATLLQLSHHETVLAHDGLAAVDLAEAFRPDVVLLDIGLPKIDGHHAARRIRAQPWGGAMILVALTGWGQDQDLRRSREAGFDHHLVKPVDLQALMQILASTAEVAGARRVESAGQP